MRELTVFNHVTLDGYFTDQIVPINVGGLRSSKMITGATLKTCPGAPHGLMTTNKQQFNADLLEFARQQPQAAASARRETSAVPMRPEQNSPESLQFRPRRSSGAYMCSLDVASFDTDTPSAIVALASTFLDRG